MDPEACFEKHKNFEPPNISEGYDKLIERNMVCGITPTHDIFNYLF